MDENMKMTLIATFISTLIASLSSVSLSLFLRRKCEQESLDNQLDSILKISIKYPYLESTEFTKTWKENCKNADEKFRRYENYATLVFNYLSRVCEFFGYKEKQIKKYIDINGWVRIHKDYWYNPTIDNENEISYDKKFKDIIHKILGEVLR